MSFTFKKARGKRTMSLDVKASAPLVFSSEEIENPGKPSPCRMKFAFENKTKAAEITTVFSVAR